MNGLTLRRRSPAMPRVSRMFASRFVRRSQTRPSSTARNLRSASRRCWKRSCRRRRHGRPASSTALPLPPPSVDAIISSESVQHLDAADQKAMIADFARVLAPGGLIVLSSPNRPEYSDARSYTNPFHRRELDRDELGRLLDGAFPARRWYRQRRYFGSALWAEEDGWTFESFAADGQGSVPSTLPAALYFVVVAARSE